MKMMSGDDEESSHEESQRTSSSSELSGSSSRSVHHHTTMRETSRIEAAADLESSSSSLGMQMQMHANNRMRKRTRPRKCTTTTATSAVSSMIGSGRVSFWVVLLLLGMAGRHTQMTGSSSLFVGAAALPGDKNTIHSSRMLRSSTAATGMGIGIGMGMGSMHTMGTDSVTDDDEDDDDDDEPPIIGIMERQRISKSSRSLQGGPQEIDVTPAPVFPATRRPSPRPTARPTLRPTSRPTLRPTRSPTNRPTARPTNRPTDPPTRRPTRAPTQRPTVPPTNTPSPLPTERRTQVFLTRPPAIQTLTFPPSRPTLAPNWFFGFLTRPPTPGPTLHRPTNAPTRAPTRQPTRAPTRAPTKQPTRAPTVQPTRRPTQQPSRAPSSTFRATSLPTVGPTRSKSSKTSTGAPTPVPTAEPAVTERLALPIDFTADVVLPVTVLSTDPASVNVFAARVAGIWERYLGAVLQEQVDLVDFVSWIGIDLTVVPGPIPIVSSGAAAADGSGAARRLTLQLRRRWLQDNANGANATAASLRLTTSGAAAFFIDVKQVNRKKFLERMQQTLDDALTMEQLQTALANGGNTATVSAVAITQADDDNGSDKPSLADIIIGFTIVAIAVASLVFWGVVLQRKRKKKLKKRARMTAMSQQKTRMAMPTPPRPPQMSLTKAETSSDGDNSSYKGVGSREEDDAVSDPFGRELEQAASLDQAAWDDFQRQKQAMDEGQRVYSSSPGRSVYETVGMTAPTFRTNSGQEQGVEVDVGGIPRTGSFPYGDEGDPEMPSNPPGGQRQAIALTADDAVAWTATGIALNVTGMAKKKNNNGYVGANEVEGWNPYKDSPSRSGLAPSYGTARQSGVSVQQPSYGNSPGRETISVRRPGYGSSPDREDPRPVSYGTSPDREVTGQALKEEKPSQYSFLYPLMRQDPSPGVNDRASPTDSSPNTSSAAVRSSPTSWSTLMGLSRASPPPADDSENENPDDLKTADMLKEVEELTQFVQQYEKKKETRKQKERERSMRLEATSELRSIPVGQQGVVNGNRNKQDAPATAPLRTERQAAKPPARRSEEPQPNSVKKDRGARVSTVANESSQRNSGRRDREVQPTENGSSRKAAELPASDFFLPKSKDMTTDSEELMYPPVVPGSFESSSASDSDSEAEDDTSQRLGISRFSVQKPPAPLLSYKADPGEQTRDDPPVPSPVQPVSRTRQEKSPVVSRPNNGARQGNSPSVSRQYQQSEPTLAENEADLSQRARAVQGSPSGRLEEKKEATQRVRPDDKTPKAKGGKRKGALSSLRGNKAMLDGAASEEVTSGSAVAPYDEVNEPIPPSQIPRTRTAGRASPLNISPRVGTRSKNKGFNSIMTMFESKPKNAIVPSSENWQYQN